VKPFQQKLWKYHSSLEPLICQELKKLLDAKIIFQVRHSAWVANLVPIRKKVWGDAPMRRFQKYQQGFRKRQLPSPTNGTTPADHF
jgi:hypothetical protein